MKTINDLLSYAKKHIDVLDSEILLSSILEKKQTYFITHFDEIISNENILKFLDLLKKRKENNSIASLLGYKNFYGKDFFVDNNVLTPRPETEILVDKSFNYIKNNNIKTVLDIGTGSGCIAITLSYLLNNKVKVIASDFSKKALVIAKKNAKKNNQLNIEFKFSDLLKNIYIPYPKSTIIVTNLPYIPTSDILDKEVLNGDPKEALFSGETGLLHYNELLKTLPKNINSVFFEFHPPQKILLESIIKKYQPQLNIGFFKDFSHKERFCILKNL
jgi:release factor glutamine methyltransferase